MELFYNKSFSYAVCCPDPVSLRILSFVVFDYFKYLPNHQADKLLRCC